jgi:hypothetical protein
MFSVHNTKERNINNTKHSTIKSKTTQNHTTQSKTKQNDITKYNTHTRSSRKGMMTYLLSSGLTIIYSFEITLVRGGTLIDGDMTTFQLTSLSFFQF